MKFNKGKYKVLHLGIHNPMHQYRLEVTGFAEKDLGVPVDSKLDISQQCAIMTKVTDSIPGCIRTSITRRMKEVILLLYSATMRHIWSAVSSSGLPSTRLM